MIVDESPVVSKKLKHARRRADKVNGVGVKTNETDGEEGEESETGREREGGDAEREEEVRKEDEDVVEEGRDVESGS